MSWGWFIRERSGCLLQEFLQQEGKAVELRGKGLLIRLRQYAKVGRKLLGFKVDR